MRLQWFRPHARSPGRTILLSRSGCRCICRWRNTNLFPRRRTPADKLVRCGRSPLGPGKGTAFEPWDVPATSLRQVLLIELLDDVQSPVSDPIWNSVCAHVVFLSRRRPAVNERQNASAQPPGPLAETTTLESRKVGPGRLQRADPRSMSALRMERMRCRPGAAPRLFVYRSDNVRPTSWAGGHPLEGIGRIGGPFAERDGIRLREQVRFRRCVGRTSVIHFSPPILGNLNPPKVIHARVLRHAHTRCQEIRNGYRGEDHNNRGDDDDLRSFAH